MVQKEVKKKTSIYGIVAVLSAVMLISMVYAFGSTSISPSLQTPGTVSNNSPSPGPTTTQISGPSGHSGMKTFSSIQELTNYLNSTEGNYYGRETFSAGTSNFAPVPSLQAIGASGVTQDYSTTNIQVAGVDEPDSVKTDGQYIYTISSTQNGVYTYYSYSAQPGTNVFIVNADPSNARVVSKIVMDSNVQPVGLFLSNDSTRLVVLSSRYQTFTPSSNGLMIMPYFASQSTSIYVYDISNKAAPILVRNFTVSGSYFDARMIGNNVYAVVSQSAYVYDGAVTVPAIYNGVKAYAASPTSIYYSDMNQSNYYSFTSFYGIDVANDQQQPTNMTVLMSGASTMYVSPTNIYVCYPNWVNGSVTDIYRVGINGLQLTFEAQGNVPGYTINQYALDEYNGNLRIATNLDQYTQVFNGLSSVQDNKVNNVYVLNPKLTIIGKLEGLAQGENLHSVRFMGDRGYLVTFVKTDPLFVIDLSQPQNPKVLGELNIPGYSDYLHPVDETHLIGVGKEATAATTGNFAWYLGLKLSLFDVSDVNNPVQVANYVIGDRGTDSPVLRDPKAFLYDKTKDLLVIPVDVAIVNQTLAQQYPSSVPAYGQTVWQGAYVFSVSTNGNFTLKGTITHINASLLNSQGQIINTMDYYTTSNQWITRSLYIGNTLYTISNSIVKLNSLNDLSQIAQVNLQ